MPTSNNDELTKAKMYAIVDGERVDVMELQGKITIKRGDKMTREYAIDVLKHNYPSSCFTDLCDAVEIAIKALSAQPEIIRCEDCIYGYQFYDVQKGIADIWVECRNPNGLNRDVPEYGYCYCGERRPDETD